MHVPGAAGCTHPPVLTFGFRNVEGLTNVRAVTGKHTSSETLFVKHGNRAWLVVKLALGGVSTSVWDEPPQFG